jgi:hypothetical protein
MNARGAILFVALVILATGTFSDANAWIEPLPAIRKLPFAARLAVLYIPYAIVVAILWWFGKLGPRLRGHMAWYLVAAALAVAEVFFSYAAPALMLVVAIVMLYTAPREGFLYEAALFPSIRAFLGLTLLAALSLRWGADIFGMDLLDEYLQNVKNVNVPGQALGLAASAIAVAIFIVAARLRYRRVQPCGASPWLMAGILACLGGAAASQLPSNVTFGFFATSGLFVAAHLALFIGAFLLLSHLLPSRESDRQH